MMSETHAPPSPVLNVLRLQSVLEYGGSDFFLELVNLFEQGFAENIRALEEAVHNCNSEKVRFMAHKMKSSALNLGADHLAQLCEDFEEFEDLFEQAEVLKNLAELKDSYIQTKDRIDFFVEHTLV